MRRPLRIATTEQLARSAREAGFDVHLLPPIPSLDFNRSIQERLTDGAIFRTFFEANDIEMVLDFNAAALTFVRSAGESGNMALATSELGIPYVACYLDPITSTLANVNWSDHWHVLENRTWIKWIWETAHAEELQKLGIPNIVALPMAAANDDYDTTALSEPDSGPVTAFMGHPASSWFRSTQGILPAQLFAGFTAAAVHADMPDLSFHKIYYDLYHFAEPPSPEDSRSVRAAKSSAYFNDKFFFNAYLAVKQRDRFARFLKLKLGDAFELIGDHWDTNYGLAHTPRIWDKNLLRDRMRRVPICLNLMKGCLESGLNIRHFEITSNGGFMLTYFTPELEQHFTVGEECDVFQNEEELLQKIAFYVDNPKRRREVAAAGQKRTLNEHLYSHRIGRLVELMRQSGLLARLGPMQTRTADPIPVQTAPLHRHVRVSPTGVAH